MFSFLLSLNFCVHTHVSFQATNKRKNYTEVTSSRQDYQKRYVNSAISKYGVGAKQAGFFLADRVGIFTRSELDQGKQYSEFVMSKKRMDELEDKGQSSDTYKGKVIHHPTLEFERQAGITSVFGDELELEESSCSVIENIFNRIAREHRHWTILVLSDVHDYIMKALQEDESHALKSAIVPTIAQTYHFYVHGFRGKFHQGTGYNPNVIREDTDINVEISFSHYQSNGELVYQQDLANLDINQDLIAKMMSYSCGGSSYKDGKNLVFELNFKNSKNRESVAKHGEFPVVGVLYYYPFISGEETNPLKVIDDDKEGEGNDGKTATETADLPSQRGHPMFKVFWNGRLVPLESLKYMRKLFKIPRTSQEYLHRIQGLIFLNETFAPSRNKLHFNMALDKSLEECGEITFRDPETTKILKSDAFQKWVSDCKDYDQQVNWFKPKDGNSNLFQSIEMLLPPNYGHDWKEPMPKEIPKEVKLKSNDVMKKRNKQLVRIIHFKKPMGKDRFVVGVSLNFWSSFVFGYFYFHALWGFTLSSSYRCTLLYR